MKDGLKYAGGILLAAVLLWIVLRGVDPAQLWASVKQASIVGLLVSAVLNIGHNVFRVWRWQALLRPVRQEIHFRPMFVAVIIGYMTSWVIPGATPARATVEAPMARPNIKVEIMVEAAVDS